MAESVSVVLKKQGEKVPELCASWLETSVCLDAWGTLQSAVHLLRWAPVTGPLCAQHERKET